MGHKITDQGIKPDDSKIEVIKNYRCLILLHPP
jgi:hypothetical protein